MDGAGRRSSNYLWNPVLYVRAFYHKTAGLRILKYWLTGYLLLYAKRFAEHKKISFSQVPISYKTLTGIVRNSFVQFDTDYTMVLYTDIVKTATAALTVIDFFILFSLQKAAASDDAAAFSLMA